MKMMTIRPAAERPQACPAADYDAIKKGGEVTLPAVKAYEAIKNSKGGYTIKPESVAVEVKTGISLNLAEMDSAQLKTIVLASGRRIQKKSMKLNELRALAQRCIEDSITVEEEDDEVDVEALAT